jgi:hypothetical protein
MDGFVRLAPAPERRLALQGFEKMAALLKEAGGIASNGQKKHADFSATGSVPDAASGSASKGGKLTQQQVAAIQASWGYLTASDFPEKVLLPHP